MELSVGTRKNWILGLLFVWISIFKIATAQNDTTHDDTDVSNMSTSFTSVSISTTKPSSSVIISTTKHSSTGSIRTTTEKPVTTSDATNTTSTNFIKTTTATNISHGSNPNSTTHLTYSSLSSSMSTAENSIKIESSTSTSLTSTSRTSTSSTSYLTSASTPGNNTNIIIGVVVGVGGSLLIALVVIIIICVCRKRKTYDRRKPTIGVHSVDNMSYITLDEIHPELPDKPIKVSGFMDYVAKHQSNIALYKAEFERLPAGDKVGKSSSFANDPQHTKLNRYINILPYDETIVHLSKDEGQRSYVNASFVDSYNREKTFIASQAPMKETLDDFWRMIWEYNCSKIIMVTKLFENDKHKCTKYWPNLNESATYGEIKIHGIACRQFRDYALRTFKMERENRSRVPKGSRNLSQAEDNDENRDVRVVYQFHFTTWPDQGVPETCTALVKLYRVSIKEPLPDCKNGPVLVHCSAGVGRTGTLIALHNSLERAKAEGLLDIPRCIDKLRRQRMYMVQTVDQYIFIHHVLLEALELGKVEAPCAQFETFYNKLNTPGPPKNQTRIQQEFQVLEVLKPEFHESMFTIATNNNNKLKNRSQNLLPVDSFIPFVRKKHDQTDIYINAVQVLGYPKTTEEDEEQLKYSYIVTQSPLRDTMEDFWYTIKETGCSTIVMLNELDGAERYWPEDGRTMTFGPFSVTNIGEISTEEIAMTDLQVTEFMDTSKAETENMTQDEKAVYANTHQLRGKVSTDSIVASTFNIRHFRLISWPESMPRETMMLSLYAQVLRCQERNPNRPILVHCLYGAERSGIFCALMNVLDTIRMESEVDVFNAVKRIRKTRPEFIQDLAQYKYLYDVAMEQIKSSDKVEYANAGSNSFSGKH